MVAGIMVSMALSSIAFAVAAILFVLLIATRGKDTIQTSGMEYPFLIWVTAVLLMLVFAQYPVSALQSAKRVLLISIVYFIPVTCATQRSFRVFVLVFAAVSGLYSLLGVVVYYVQDLDRLGFFQHYMTAGGIRMMLLLFFLPMLFHPSIARSDRLIIAVSMVFTLFALILTQTRSSWLGFAAGVVFLGVVRYRIFLPALAVLAVLFLLAAPTRYVERVTYMFSFGSVESVQRDDTNAELLVQSNLSRIRMIRTGWRMFLEYPIFGVGDGEMHAMYRTYVPDAVKDEGGHLHNNYVHVLATHGAIGASAMLVLFVAIGRREWRLYRRAPSSLAGVTALGAFAAFVGFLVNGLAEYNFGDHEILVILWTTLGLTLAAAHTSTTSFRTMEQVEE